MYADATAYCAPVLAAKTGPYLLASDANQSSTPYTYVLTRVCVCACVRADPE